MNQKRHINRNDIMITFLQTSLASNVDFSRAIGGEHKERLF